MHTIIHGPEVLPVVLERPWGQWNTIFLVLKHFLSFFFFGLIIFGFLDANKDEIWLPIFLRKYLEINFYIPDDQSYFLLVA